MTTRLVGTKIKATLAAVMTATSLASYAELPQGEFACQVQTVGGQSGLVLVQADLNADAVRVAGSATAAQMGGGQSKAIAVVECIRVPGENFKDSWFNSFYKEFPQ